MRGEVAALPARLGQGGLREQMGGDRRGDEQEQRDRQLPQSAGALLGADMQQRCEHDRADAQRRRLGRPVQPHEEIRQPGESDRAEQREGGADQKQHADKEIEDHCPRLTR